MKRTAIAGLVISTVCAIAISFRASYDASLARARRADSTALRVKADSAYRLAYDDTVLLRADSMLKASKAALPEQYLARLMNPMDRTLIDRFMAIEAEQFRRMAPVSEARAAKARRGYGPDLENAFLDQRIDAHIKTLGSQATTLQINYTFASRVFAHEFAKREDLFTKWRTMGFKRIELIGHDYATAWEF